MSVLPKGRFFTANLGTKAPVLPKGRSFSANSGTKFEVLGTVASRCFPHPALSSPCEQTLKDLKRSQEPQRVSGKSGFG